MKIIDLAFVCYAVTDLKKGRRFYEKVLGLKETKSWVSPDGKMGMIEYDIGAGTLAIGAGADVFKPGAKGGVAALEVEDFDAAIRHLKKRRVKFKGKPHDSPVCQMAILSDPDGNTLVVHRRKNR